MDTYKNDQEAIYDTARQIITNTKRYPRKICERENGCLKRQAVIHLGFVEITDFCKSSDKLMLICITESLSNLVGG